MRKSTTIFDFFKRKDSDSSEINVPIQENVHPPIPENVNVPIEFFFSFEKWKYFEELLVISLNFHHYEISNPIRCFMKIKNFFGALQYWA